MFFRKNTEKIVRVYLEEGNKEKEIYCLLKKHYEGVLVGVARKEGSRFVKEDVQDTFIEFIKHIHKPEKSHTVKNFKSYLCRMLINLINTRRKRKDSKNEISFDPSKMVDQAITPVAVNNELLNQIKEVFPLLSPADKKLLEEYYFQGLTHREISNKKEGGEGSSRVSKNRAIKHLKELIQEKKYLNKVSHLLTNEEKKILEAHYFSISNHKEIGEKFKLKNSKSKLLKAKEQLKSILKKQEQIKHNWSLFSLEEQSIIRYEYFEGINHPAAAKELRVSVEAYKKRLQEIESKLNDLTKLVRK